MVLTFAARYPSLMDSLCRIEYGNPPMIEGAASTFGYSFPVFWTKGPNLRLCAQMFEEFSPLT